jgi:cytochrome c-type biogenesis protein CcmH/NrfF
MKKILSLSLIVTCFAFFACSDVLELDLLDDPNSPTPETADLESLYNGVQLAFESVLSTPQFFTMQLSRQRAFTAGNVYETAWSPVDFDAIWRAAYSSFIPDANAVIDRASQTNQLFHTGSAKIMQAYTYVNLVDIFGDVPLDEAGQGIDVLSPMAQSGESVYQAAVALAREGIADLQANEAAAPSNDFMYGGNADGWIAAGNSLLMKIAVNTRDFSSFNTLVDSAMYITDAVADWQFQYGSNRDNPDSRHPLYIDSYEVDDGQYMSNWLMWALTEDKTAEDPRARAYFNRTVAEVPLDNPNRFDCIFSVLPDADMTPDHYTNCDTRMPYCVGSLSNGYYGRDHGNGNGTPPDGDIRTVYGVYPAGGKFDNEVFASVLNNGTDGALGAGIHPILTQFMMNFYRAEMAMEQGDVAIAREQLEAGVRNSISKAVGFISRDQASLDEVFAKDLDCNQLFGQSIKDRLDTIAEPYVLEVLQRFDDASDKMEVIGMEQLIASYGNGIEGYNMIRRIARPTNIQPAILTTAGTMSRSALYPAVHVNLNQNATQKTFLDQVFWDTQPASLGTCFN